MTCSLGLWLFDLQLAVSVPTETDAATPICAINEYFHLFLKKKIVLSSFINL